jgi:hypothetical protein
MTDFRRASKVLHKHIELLHTNTNPIKAADHAPRVRRRFLRMGVDVREIGSTGAKSAVTAFDVATKGSEVLRANTRR